MAEFFLKRAPFQAEISLKNQTHFSRLNPKNPRLLPEMGVKNHICFSEMKTQKPTETLPISVHFSHRFWVAPWGPVPNGRLTMRKHNCPASTQRKRNPQLRKTWIRGDLPALLVPIAFKCRSCSPSSFRIEKVRLQFVSTPFFLLQRPKHCIETYLASACLPSVKADRKKNWNMVCFFHASVGGGGILGILIKIQDFETLSFKF